MITSMTGFGLAERKSKLFSIEINIRSTNNRFFDSNIKIPNSISTPVHPNDERMGMRTWDMIGGEIYIENEDAQKGSLRLKEFADITLKGEPSPVANIDSYERSDKRPIVHWITMENSLEGTLLSTSNDEIQTVQGRIEKHNFAPGTIVQLERIGYACIKEDGSFILCHESFDE